MSFRKTLADRLLKISKVPIHYLENCRISSSFSQARILANSRNTNIQPDPGNNGGIFRRLFHKRALFQSPELRLMRTGENLVEKLRAFDIARDRIRLEGLFPPPPQPAEGMLPEKEGLAVEDARKLLRVAQLEMVKLRLREMENAWIPYSELVLICRECCSDPEQGLRVAKTLDESGAVVVMGKIVMIKPEQERE